MRSGEKLSIALPNSGAHASTTGSLIAPFVSSPTTSTSEHDKRADDGAHLHVRWFMDEVHRHESSLKNYVRHSFPSVRDVDDVIQESYLRVWKRQLSQPITEITGSVKASVRGFLFQVARRLALNLIRHEQASPVDEEVDCEAVVDHATDVSVREALSAEQEYQLVLQAIDRLPARCREVVRLRKVQGKSPAETAHALGISEETVHVQTRRGLQRIQAFLRAQGVISERSR